MNKTCSKCKIEKDLSLFNKRLDRPLGVRSKCKLCEKELTYTYRHADTERYNSYQRQRRHKDLDAANSASRQWRKKYHEIYGCSPETTQRRNNIQFKIASSLRTRLNSAIKDAYKAGSAVRDLGCSVEELKMYLEAKFTLKMSWANWGRGAGTWQIDHIKPLCSFDLSKPEQFQQAVHYTNLQPLLHEEHILKTLNDNKERRA